ncbi:MAG: HD domain-containing protein [Erysipelotrichaceae bacterium]
MSKLERAFVFACKAHEGMIRKGFNQNYIFHPMEVLSLASILTDDEDVLCAAMLHDTVEDTKTTIEDIETHFGPRVKELVARESEDKKEGMAKSDSWEIRKQEAIENLKKDDDIGVKIICLCDKLSNLRSFQLLCFDKGDEAWDSFNMKDPKKHYWYYNSMKEALSELKDTPVYKEYDFLIHSVFDKYLGGVYEE